MSDKEILVIGGGPAGITIAKLLGKRKSVGIIRPEDYSMIYCAMPYAIEGLMPAEKVFKKDVLVTDAGAELIRGTVTQVAFDQKTVTLHDGRVYRYDKLIIATGAEPVRPPIQGADLNNVHVFKTQKDLERVQQAVKSDQIKKAVVVGAGAIGIELVQALNHVHVQTHLVDMAPSVLPNLVDADFSQEVLRELSDLGIHVHLNSSVRCVEGTDTAERVVLADGATLSLDGSGIVVFAVGMHVNTALFEGTGLEIGRQGIVINNKMETSIRDVYAVGDCAQYISGITGEPVPGKLATNAVPMARMLAKNLLGDHRTYRGFYNGAATKVGKYFIGGTGLTVNAAQGRFDVVIGVAELTTAFPIMPNARPAKMKLVADKNTLNIIGGQVLAEVPVTDKVDMITLAIQAGLTVRDLTGFSYSAQPYQSFFPANNLIVACAENILGKLDKG